jgi:demethylmenaquinone methyltransferase/2-methoxy-6-polyprenyl-1,4-benzoquinol methylase
MSEVKPYRPEGSKKEQVAAMFDAISPKYDALNRILSAGIDQSWRRKTLREIRGTGALTLLDVATGTADLALALAKGIPTRVPFVVHCNPSGKLPAITLKNTSPPSGSYAARSN